MHADEACVGPLPAGGIWRYSPTDRWLVAASLAQGAAFAALAATFSSGPGAVLVVAAVGCGLWWGSNTHAHNFIHLPYFRDDALNRLYSLYLSVLLGVPQTLWRERHLAHHAGRSLRIGSPFRLLIESMAVLSVWAILLIEAPAFLLTIYMPGYLIGLGLCLLQGRFEHSPATTSHYGRIYNALFFNDGYHVEHHANPRCHWTRLPGARAGGGDSRYPAVLRWLEQFSLVGLERAALAIPPLQRHLLKAHERAVRALLPTIGPVENVTIVGGGLFPRSVLVMRELFPAARIRVVDVSMENIAIARRYLERVGSDHGVEFVHARFEPGSFDAATDLLVTPLSLIGSRQLIYSRPPAHCVLIHDWLWNRRSAVTALVSWLLLKRINLVRAD